MGSPGLKKKTFIVNHSLSQTPPPLPPALPLSKRSAHCKDRLLNIFYLITKKASLLGVIKNHKLALRLSRCESSPAPLATIQAIQMGSGWLTAAVRLLSQTRRSPSRRGCSQGGWPLRVSGLCNDLAWNSGRLS